jgi:hypothetical protein
MAVRDCAVALLAGAVLQTDDVTAGFGCVVDWRTVKCGDTIIDRADAFDTARVFVDLVGVRAARKEALAHSDPTSAVRRAFLHSVRAQQGAPS